ncbi:AAA domain-containing protein [Streptosporangium sp. NBC_01495]|uniref:DEAD/DEAH box helicase n=1 Tax=Streptosporangium sp. NBC_01495 TaxID=2903899 RepID=UPI002E309672|nr:AAA domain-containing protein [Streptosporangium sp. NBC_01495]
MTVPQVFLSVPVAVVPSRKVYDQLAPHSQPERLIAEMSHLAAVGALPARVEEDRGRLAVYTDRYVAWLYVSQRGDAYSLGHASPRTFKDEERLVRGAMTLRCAAGWHAFHQLRDVPRETMSAHWPLLLNAWAAVGRPEDARPKLPPRHTSYLDLMARVVEAGRDIEVARQHQAPPLHYRRRESAREERHSVRGVYTFHLVRPAELAAGAVVYLADRPDLRGRVVRVKNREVVVRFEGAIDYNRIPNQGALMIMPSDRVFRAQAETIEVLREGEAVNHRLLSQLVDRQVSPFGIRSEDRPHGTLDPDRQLLAFRRALAVPDLLLILGPPGTGKTRTITEIAAACTARGERVLITSHTNRAVDNVLEQLPGGIRAVRVGNEDAMTGHARGFMVETHVKALKEDILAATEGTVSRLAVFTSDGQVADRWMAHLGDSLAEARTAERAVRDHTAAFDVVIRRAAPPVAERIAVVETGLGEIRATMRWLEEKTVIQERRRAAVDRRARAGILAFLFRWLEIRLARKLESTREELATLHAQAERAVAELDALRSEAERLLADDPEAVRLVAVRDTAVRRRDDEVAEAGKAMAVLRAMIGTAMSLPAPEDRPEDLDGLERLHGEMRHAVALLGRRAAMLGQWRAGIGDAEQDLQRELVRYAEVVAATCIGTATTKLLADLEFDLVIVDEAGQISTPNLLVPLTRARRSILVGDHQQLPPYLDDEVREWGEGLARDADTTPAEVREVGDILRMSAFERLYGKLPEDHKVMLTRQRRMPREIGTFVSDAFYDGILATDHPGDHDDPIFTSPFAMVDTADRPAAERRERPGGRGDDGAGRGYVNAMEADLIVRLVTVYARRYKNWAVIVPYRAQAERIRAELARTLGDTSAAAENVGTVDSFQGGERDLVVYGFTRSNDGHEVGFLKELRRLNVAVSRARRQLVLVGDTATLGGARDRKFRELVVKMLDHLRRDGDLRPSREVTARLDGLESEPA